jgi:hypothetical protein
MQRVVSALAGAIVSLASAAGAFAQTTTPPMVMTMAPMAPSSAAGGAMRTMPMPAGTPALDARYLRAVRTATGYTITGQALVKDACQAARFDQVLGNIFPPFYNLNQFRRPGILGISCIQRLTWVTVAPKSVTSAAPPRWITVHTQKGTVRVPILAH